MIIRELKMDHFGRFQHENLKLEPGINVIYGANESGKSTAHAFIRCMLFGARRQRGKGAAKDAWSKYQPWEGSGSYSGILSYEYQGKDWRIVRDFARDSQAFELVDESAGVSMDTDGREISDFIGGLTPVHFDNSMSIGQMAAEPDSHFAEDMQSFMANMSMGANEAVDVKRALQYLKDERRRLKNESPDARIEAVAARLEEIGRELPEMDDIYARQSEIAGRMKALDQEIEAVNRQADEEQKADQAERVQAARLIQQNNDIAEQYRAKKDELAQAQARMQPEAASEQIREIEAAYAKTEERMRQVRSECDHVSGLLSGGFLRMLALALPFVVLALLCFVLGEQLNLTGGRQAAAVLILLLAGAVVLIIAGFIHSRRKGRLRRLMADLAGLEEKQASLLARCNIQSIEQLRVQGQFQQHCRDTVIRLKKELSQLRQRYEALQGPLKPYIEKYGETISTDSLAGEVTRVQAISLAQEKENLRKQYDKLEWQLERLMQLEAEQTALEEELVSLRARADEVSRELEAVDLAEKTVGEITEKIHGTFGSQLNDYVSALISQITDGAHRRLIVDRSFAVMADDGSHLLSPDRLSAGTADQIWFCVRMAASQILFEEKMPLILDDSFAFYDDDRLVNTLKFLKDQNTFSQIILFTCHHREAEALEGLEIPFNYVSLS